MTSQLLTQQKKASPDNDLKLSDISLARNVSEMLIKSQ